MTGKTVKRMNDNANGSKNTLRIIQFCIYKIRYYTKLGLILKPSDYYIIKYLVYKVPAVPTIKALNRITLRNFLFIIENGSM